MRCDDFSQRFHEVLDARQSPWDDSDMRDHAIECRECEEMLVTWGELETCMLITSKADVSEKAAERAPTISLATSPTPHRSFKTQVGETISAMRYSYLAGIAMAASLVFLMLYPGQTQTQPSPPVAQRTQTPTARTVNTTADSVQLIAWDGYTLDLHRISEQVRQPSWWGSVVIAAWKPVDPLTEGIRPLTESIESALRLLDPRMHLRTPAANVKASEDISAGKPELLAQLA